MLLFFFFFLAFSCNIEAGAPGRQEIICPDVVKAGVTAVIVVFFFVVFGALFFSSYSSFLFCNIEVQYSWQRAVIFCTNKSFTSSLCRHSLLEYVTCFFRRRLVLAGSG